jgi:pimeloyl-ACP methyl ester carboxylesterase
MKQTSDLDDLAKLRAGLSVVPEGHTEGVLDAYGGVPVPAPLWAQSAIKATHDEGYIVVDGARIHWKAWGPVGAPGVLLLHGNGAHLDWWSFLAPQLAQEGRRVAAFSFSGMGGSDWRDHYTMDHFIKEAFAVAEASGLNAAPSPPIFAGHSFGGFPALAAASQHPDKIGGLVMLDSSIEPPGEGWTGPPKRTAPNRVYPSLREALARFRLAPPQICDTHWALDHIARGSLKEVEGGWTWTFDPFLWNQFEFEEAHAIAAQLNVPAIVMRGGLSILMPDRIFDYMAGLFPAGTAFVTIPEARHHVMLDQPLATLAALNVAFASLTVLPHRGSRG